MEHGRASLLSTLMMQEVLFLLFMASLLTTFLLLGVAMWLHQSKTTLSQALQETHRHQRAQAETIAALQATNGTLQAGNHALQAQLEEARRRLEELTKTITTLTHDQPPSITLAESEERFRFPLGSAELSPMFRESLLKDVVPQILHAQHKYYINTVQVIGHTDEVPVSNLASTLDKHLIAFIAMNAAIAPGSNTDLAMLRAVAVLKVLRVHPALKDLNLVPYSAGQVLLPGDVLSLGQEKGQNPDRRRVVIRLTRS